MEQTKREPAGLSAEKPEREPKDAHIAPGGEDGGASPGGEGELSARTHTEDKLFFYDGVPMTEARLCFPAFRGEGSDPLNAFYGGMEQGCLRYVEGTLSEISRRRYLEDPSPRRRFLHRRLVFQHKTRIYRPAGFVSLCREVEVLYRGRVLWHRTIGEVWDMEGQLCAPERFLKHARGKRRGAFYLDDGGRPVMLEEEDFSGKC